MNYPELLETLRLARKVKSISQYYIARKMQISQANYSKMESGILLMNFYQMERIAEMLGFDLEINLLLPGEDGTKLVVKNIGWYELSRLKNDFS